MTLSAVPDLPPAPPVVLPEPDTDPRCTGRWWGPYGCVDTACGYHRARAAHPAGSRR